MPAADDLFRPTAVPSEQPTAEPTDAHEQSPTAVEPAPEPAPEAAPEPRRPSGRVRHDEKMTVYVTADELLDLEHARLTLRRTTGQAVDRGRLVREAVAIALADLDRNGEDSVLFQRLMQS